MVADLVALSDTKDERVGRGGDIVSIHICFPRSVHYKLWKRDP